MNRLTTKQRNEYVDAVTHGERQLWAKQREIRVYYAYNGILHGINPDLNSTHADMERQGFYLVKLD